MLDLILLAIIAFCVIKYYRGGITGTIFGIGKFLLSIICAVIFGGLVGRLLADGPIGSLVNYGMRYRISDYLEERSMSSFLADPPEGFIRFTKMVGADLSSLQNEFGGRNDDRVLGELAERIARPVTETVSGILGYVAVFLVMFIAATIVISCLKKIKIPVLTSIDKWLGLGLGVVIGVLGASLLSTVFYTALEVAAALTGDGGVMRFYEDSIVFKFIYDLKVFEFVRNLI